MLYLAIRLFSFLLFLSIFASFSEVCRSETFSITPVALQGQPAPGTGGTFLELFSSSLNDSGDVVFRALIAGGNTRQGIFLSSGGKIFPVALEGQVAPGTGGLKMTNFSWTSVINDAGEVAFDAALEGFYGGIFLFSKGEISLIALGSQMAPGTNSQFLDFGRLSINDSGSVAFSAGSGGSGSIFLYSDGAISLIAAPQQPAPGQGASMPWSVLH